jgi:hypothetical protein
VGVACFTLSVNGFADADKPWGMSAALLDPMLRYSALSVWCMQLEPTQRVAAHRDFVAERLQYIAESSILGIEIGVHD